MPTFTFKCETCGLFTERFQKHTDDAPVCSTIELDPSTKEMKETSHGPMVRQLSTPAFTFKNGRGTDGGHTMRIAKPAK